MKRKSFFLLSEFGVQKTADPYRHLTHNKLYPNSCARHRECDAIKMFRHSIELCIVLLLFVTLNSVYNVCATLSGFYVDNGNDQTVMHRALTQDDVQEVEHEILELLGLPERPRRRHNIHPSLRYANGFSLERVCLASDWPF